MTTEITLRFVTCHDLVSATIRGAEMGFWASHVETLMPDGFLLGAHYQGGVASRVPDYDKGQWSKESFVKIPCTDEELTTYCEFMKAQVGKPYDLEAIGEMAIGFITSNEPDWSQKQSWICSALVMAGLIKAGLLLSSPVNIRTCTPRDVICMLAALTSVPEPVGP